MLKTRSIVTLIAVLFLFSTTAFASLAGSLDKRFDADGKVTVVNGSFSNGRDVAVQPDGKIVIVGNSTTTDIDFSVIRLNADGSLDTSFDGDGKVVTDIAGGLDDAIAVEILPDGKILVAGNAIVSGTGTDFALVRYNPNGSLDTTFDGDGKVTTDFGSTTAEGATNILVQSDGRYVLAGRAFSASNDYAAARYNTNGSLDTTFDGDGKVIVSISANADLQWSAALQSDQKIIIVGSANGIDFGVVRLNPNGALDTSFDTDGIATTDISAGSVDSASGVAIQPDGKIVVDGGASLNSGDFAAVRYNSNGSLDTTGFGTGGKVTTNFSGTSSDGANGIVLQPDGRIIAIGQTNQNGTNDFALVRYTAGGIPDTTFDGDGKVITDFTASDRADEGVLQADGRLLVVGNASPGNSVTSIARYNLRNFNVAFDFDGDDKTDIGIYRPSAGEWWYSRSSDNQVLAAQFGASLDKLAPGDYTGDGRADIAFYRPPNGTWYILRSEDGSFFSFPFGNSNDIPAPADYDGDGKTDPAVFRPSTATWYILQSSGGTGILTFGATGDKPVSADYDGDGKADIAIFRPSDGSWWYLQSTNAQFKVYRFGVGTDKPVQGDYTGDGRADIAIFRPSTGEWFIQRSEDNSFYSVPFGASGDTPVAGDYDGDGKFDTSVFRPSSTTWFINRSTAGTSIVTFGSAGDQPLPAAFVP